MTSAPELRPAATSAAIVAIAGASSVILPAGAHWAVARRRRDAAAVLAALHRGASPSGERRGDPDRAGCRR